VNYDKFGGVKKPQMQLKENNSNEYNDISEKGKN
jgi:hypothetical protein